MISALYIEESVREHPRTLRLTEKFSSVPHIDCERYTEIFNKKAQNFRLQKQRPSLILAKKFAHHVLPAPTGYGIGGRHNYYFSHLLNCIYDCRYCFLQGMYRSANYVFFVNYEDFQQAITETLHAHDKGEAVYFFSGYDCDSLALESVTHFVEEFLPFFQTQENAYLELRTKSIHIHPLQTQDPLPNCIMAFSLTPACIAQHLEHKAPPLPKRIQAMQILADRGWKIGLRFDPLIYHENFQENYRELFAHVFTAVDSHALHSVSLGSLRFPKNMFETIAKLYPEEPLFGGGLSEQGKMVSYGPEIEEEMHHFCREELCRYLDPAKIFSCPLQMA